LAGVTVAAGDVEGSGYVATIPMALAFAFAARNSIWTFLFGISFERALFYHKLCAWSSLVCGCIHGYYGVKDEGMGDEDSLTGIVLVAAFGLLIASSINIIRRRLFEVFYYLHWVFFIIVILMGFAHGASTFGVGLLLWLVDVGYRIYLAGCRNTKKVSIIQMPSNVVRISFPKDNFTYKGGQYLFICIPKLGFFQWHPFSLSSAPWEPEVHLHVRILGNWTQSLYDMAGEEAKEVDAYIEGPYGEPITDVDSGRYKCFLLVSGGIGVTPMQSICNQLLYDFARGRPIVKIWFVWAVRDKFMLESILAYNADYYKTKMHAGRLPMSFSPDMLLSHSLSVRGKEHCQDGTEFEQSHNKGFEQDGSNADPLHAEYFLTRVREADTFDMAGIHPSLQNSLRFGRPKLPVIFDKMKEIAKAAGEDKVAALCCGPDVIIQEMKQLSKSKSDRDVKFDVHMETFNF
jgi:predicted ferric reductase